MRDLLEIAAVRDRVTAGGAPAVLATVVRLAGSAYRKPGARLLVLPDGTMAGGVSGGCLEADVVAHAERARGSGRAELLSYDLTTDDAPWGLGMRCGGRLDLLVEPLPNGFPDHLDFLLDAARRRAPAVLATLFQVADGEAGAGVREAPGRSREGPRPAAGMRLMLDAEGGAAGPLFGTSIGAAVLADARIAMSSGDTSVHSYPSPEGRADVLVEFVPPPLLVLVCGAEREAAHLRALAAGLGWEVRAIGKGEAPPPLDERAAAVLMTHNQARDLELLPALLRSRAPYVGLLGSCSRAALLLAELRERGDLPDEAALSRLHTPAGLDIGAEGPAEVALSIVAEIRAVFAGREGGKLRDSKGRVHASR